ncbi:twin-arginine translocase TatA/TatE family subunit [Propionibacterium sp.]|uniref:twin-arginine translocase TatA/TatE family subunit n=1 Tax=Propionibacterium sp. TaxID=1977903 RepID=UPI0039E75623
MDLGWQELLIVLLIAVLIFGGSRLAGLGKATGKAIKEFKQETHDLHDDDQKKGAAAPGAPVAQAQAQPQQPPAPQQIAPAHPYQQTPAQPYQPPQQYAPQNPQQYAAQPPQQSVPQQIVDGEIVDPGQNS